MKKRLEAPLRVLFVDDEADITSIIKANLDTMGFEVEAFNDPVRAYKQYKPGSYDIILLDIHMPAMSGFQLAREIWRVERNVKICFLTAFEIYEMEAEKVFGWMGDNNKRCFLRKPIGSEELARHIKTQLGLPTADVTSSTTA